MFNQKIEKTIKSLKELYKYSVKKDDLFLEEQLMQIIVELSTLSEIEKNRPTQKSHNVTEEDEIQKVFRKVPRWLKNPDQYNSKILNAFMSLYIKGEPVNIHLLEEASKLDSKRFLVNYTQMKIIAEKNHAKVFDEEGDNVYLWKPVSDFIEDLYAGIFNAKFDAYLEVKERLNKNVN